MERYEIEHNLSLPPLEVRHKELKKIGDSEFRSECPVCKTGILMVKREFETFRLKKDDNCISCGRRFIYTDLKEEFVLTYKTINVKIRFNTECTDDLHYWRALIDGVEHLATNIHIHIPCSTSKDFLEDKNKFKWHINCDADRIGWMDGELHIY